MKFLLFLLLGLSCQAAVVFDGVDDILGFGAMGDVVVKEDASWSVSMWCYPLTDGESNAGVFVRKGQTILRALATHAIQFTQGGGTTLTRASNGLIFITNIWFHLAMTYDGTTNASGCHIYTNGVEVGYATTTNGQTPTDNAADSLTVGNNVTTAGTWNGQLTEVAVYAGILSASDIANLSKSRTTDVPKMVTRATGATWAYWKLTDFSAGATVTGVGAVRDSSGNGYHGTATNSPVAAAQVVVTGL